MPKFTDTKFFHFESSGMFEKEYNFLRFRDPTVGMRKGVN